MEGSAGSVHDLGLAVVIDAREDRMCRWTWRLRLTRRGRLEAHNAVLRRALHEADVVARVWRLSAEHREGSSGRVDVQLGAGAEEPAEGAAKRVGRERLADESRRGGLQRLVGEGTGGVAGHEQDRDAGARLPYPPDEFDA